MNEITKSLPESPVVAERPRNRPWTIVAAAVLSGAGALGAALLAIAHLGLDLPGLSAFGPSGQAVLPAAIGFGVATALLALLTWGLWSGRRWAWPAGTGLALLGILSGIGQFRGMGSAIGLGVMVVLLVLLVMPSARDHLAGPRDELQDPGA